MNKISIDQLNKWSETHNGFAVPESYVNSLQNQGSFDGVIPEPDFRDKFQNIRNNWTLSDWVNTIVDSIGTTLSQLLVSFLKVYYKAWIFAFIATVLALLIPKTGLSELAEAGKPLTLEQIATSSLAVAFHLTLLIGIMYLLIRFMYWLVNTERSKGFKFLKNEYYTPAVLTLWEFNNNEFIPKNYRVNSVGALHRQSILADKGLSDSSKHYLLNLNLSQRFVLLEDYWRNGTINIWSNVSLNSKSVVENESNQGLPDLIFLQQYRNLVITINEGLSYVGGPIAETTEGLAVPNRIFDFDKGAATRRVLTKQLGGY